ncbi:glycosyltransferase family 4 protein [Desulfonatronovibrio hydrogenovorans]|uniref:glycosyltransferase family 4 protein n=1 Tax=Desulfonatronovibrio hydrogenovorans TaxID=53245 RepID=UPI00048DF1E4|nr:glycosyltransferase family 4 protein [Desulfonatronovibrio hydrogenovorans]
MVKKIWGTLDPFFEGGPFLGRKVANTGFIRALVRADPFDEYHFFLESQKKADSCRSFFQKEFKDKSAKIRLFPRTKLLNHLTQHQYHAFHLSDCINHPAHLSRLRNKYAKTIFPITSITHSLSYSSYSHQLLKQIWPGWSSRDRIICSSRCGQSVLGNYFDYLRRSYSLPDNFQPPALEHIPLGIDLQDWITQKTSEKAPASDKVQVLCLGRLSPYSKMDLLPLLKAVQLAGINGLDLKSMKLILAGGVDQKDDTINKLSALAANLGLEMMVFASPGDQLKNRLLNTADVFVSIADNPQETFGLTLLEAQAAGLPVLASDYNGYRELIRNGENGFLIPTLGPVQTGYIDDLAPLIFDSESHLLLAQSCAVDIRDLAKKLTTLIRDPQLRSKMSRKSLANVQKYDWNCIIQRYLELWDSLNLKPESGQLGDIPHPCHTPYGDIFAGYTSGKWMDQAVCLSRLGQAVYRKKDFPVIYSGLSHLVTPDGVRMLLFLARSPVKSSILTARLSAAMDLDPSVAGLILSWSLKQGLLETCLPETSA